MSQFSRKSLTLLTVIFGGMLSSLIAAASSVTSGAAADVPISIFAFAIDKVARQRNVPVEEAGRMLREAGIRGFDVDCGNSRIEHFLKSGLQPVNVYGRVNLLDRAAAEKDMRTLLDAAERCGVTRVMILPCPFSSPTADRQADVERMVPQLKACATAARKRGMTATIEDFGYVNNPCGYAPHILRFLEAAPDLDFTVDTGNLICVDRTSDILALTRSVLTRVRHVHLKDFDPAHVNELPNREVYCTLGKGVIPNRAVVEEVARAGYVGWYTLENPVGDDIYDDLARQSALLRTWVSRAKEPLRRTITGASRRPSASPRRL